MDGLFESQRLIYQLLHKRDQEFYVNLYTNHELTQFIGGPLTQQQAQNSMRLALKKQQKKQSDYLVIKAELKGIRHAVGITGLTNIDHLNHTADLGIILAHEFHQQKLSSEMYRSTLSFAANKLSLRKVYSRMDHKNSAMEKLAVSTGFRKQSVNQQTKQLIYSITF